MCSNLNSLINFFIEDNCGEKYINQRGLTSVRLFGSISMFHALVVHFGLTIIYEDYYTAEAIKDGLTLTYCEHDLILTFEDKKKYNEYI